MCWQDAALCPAPRRHTRQPGHPGRGTVHPPHPNGRPTLAGAVSTATAGAGGRVLGSSWGTGEKASPVPAVVQKDDPHRGGNVIQEVKVLFGDPEVLPSLRVTLGVSPGRRPPPGGSRGTRTSPRAPPGRHRPSAAEGPAAPPLRSPRRLPQPPADTGPEARSLPAGRWCGSAPLLRVCSRSHRQPADRPHRGAAHTLSPLADEMSFRFAATDQCAHSGPQQGARGTPVPAEQTDRSRGRPCAPVWGMGYRGQTASAPAATPSVRGPSRLAPVAADPGALFACSVPRGSHSLSSACGQWALILL